MLPLVRLLGISTRSTSSLLLNALVLNIFLCPFTVAQVNECNLTSQYFDASQHACLPCTDCSAHGQEIYLNCSATNDTECRCPVHQYYNRQTKQCVNCTICTAREPVKTECTSFSDAVCHECEEHQFYNPVVKRCTLDCTLCPGECASHDECQCRMCETGILCDEKIPGCEDGDADPSPSDIPTRSNGSDDSSLNPVMSALIAVGAVAGIIIFSAMFVLLGVFTSCRKGNSQNDTASSNSTDTFLFTGKQSTSLTSLYLTSHSPSPSQEYRTSLDILKHSNGNLNGSWGTPKGSPRSGRSPVSLSYKSRDMIWTPV